jgi:hypothetical protein
VAGILFPVGAAGDHYSERDAAALNLYGVLFARHNFSSALVLSCELHLNRVLENLGSNSPRTLRSARLIDDAPRRAHAYTDDQ